MSSTTRPTYTQQYQYSHAFQGTRLVLGTSGLGGVWGGVDLEESADTIRYALYNGVTAFDTAPSYGEAQEVLGKVLREWKGPRPFISTKVGRLKAADAHTTHTDYSLSGIRRSFQQTLATLAVDSVDVLFLHEPQLVPDKDIPAILELLQQFKATGSVKMLGIGGNLTPAFRPYMGVGKFEVVSGFLNMNACRLDAFREDVPFLKANDIKYYNASVLHFGLLGTRLERYRVRVAEEPWLKPDDILHADRLAAIARRINMPLATLALRYAMAIGEADRIVIGAKNKTQLKESLATWAEGPIPRVLFDEITSSILSH